MAVGFTSVHQHSNCCSTGAAAGTSVRFGLFLDTVILAVSIFIIFLLGLLGMK